MGVNIVAGLMYVERIKVSDDLRVRWRWDSYGEDDGSGSMLTAGLRLESTGEGSATGQTPKFLPPTSGGATP